MKAIKTMRGPERISTLEFDPTGSYIIAGGVFGEMIIWETLFFDHETTIYLSEYYFNEGIANNVDSISFSPDGELMAVGKFLSVKIYDVSSWTEIRELDLERGGINQVRFSPDGSQLLIGASPTLMENETVLSLWDTSMWIEIKNLSIPVFPNYSSVLSMEWNSGGTRIALGLDNETVTIVDVGSWAVERSFTVYTVHSIVEDLKDTLCVSWDPNGDRIAAGYWNNITRIWTMDSETPVTTFTGHGKKLHSTNVNGIRWSPDGKRIASVGSDTTVKVWDPEDGALIHDIGGNREGVTSWTFIAGTEDVVIGDSEGQIFNWNIPEGDDIWNISTDLLGSPVASGTSPNGSYLAIGYSGYGRYVWNTLIIWDLKDRTEVFKIRTGGFIYSLAWSPDGKYLLYSGDDIPVEVYSTSNWTKVYTIDQYNVNDISFSPVGDIFSMAIGSTDLLVFSSNNWSLSYELQEDGFTSHEKRINVVEFSPDGSRLVSGAWDGTILIWDLEERSWKYTLRGHEASISSLSWDPKDEYILSSSMDNTVKLWNLSLRDEIWTEDVFRGDRSYVQWDATGRYAGYASFNSLVILWDGTVTQNEIVEAPNNTGNETQEKIENDDESGSMILIIIIIAVIMMISVALVIFMMIRGKKKQKEEAHPTINETPTEPLNDSPSETLR